MHSSSGRERPLSLLEKYKWSFSLLTFSLNDGFKSRINKVSLILQIMYIRLSSGQSRSQSFVPLDQRSENESSGSIRFEITIGNNWILVIRFTAQSQIASMACYGACLKWLLPEFSFSDRWSRGTKLWERDCPVAKLSVIPFNPGRACLGHMISNGRRMAVTAVSCCY